MAKWEVPTREEAEIIKAQGLDPTHCAVSHPGENQMVILDWKDHRTEMRETYVRLPENVRIPTD